MCVCVCVCVCEGMKERVGEEGERERRRKGGCEASKGSLI